MTSSARLRVKQITRPAVQTSRESVNGFEPCISLAALDPADVVAVQSSAISKFFLAQLGSESEEAYRSPKFFKIRIAHLRTVAENAASLYTQ